MSAPRVFSNIATVIPRAAKRSTRRTTSLRTIRQSSFQRTQAQATASQSDRTSKDNFSNPQLSFPCLDNAESKTRELQQSSKRSLSGPEPSYTTGAHQLYHSAEPLLLDWGGILPSFDIAWEAWGTLNGSKSNAILIHTGLSASSHARSTESNPQPGWWEKFIGPGAPLDTNKYFIICTNVLGGCYGSTGPSSLDPTATKDGKRKVYGTSFPILTLTDMVRAQYRLLDSMGIGKLYASVGSSMGGMQSLALALLAPERVGKLVTVSACARSHPYSIAMRHTQRQVIMNDPAWSNTRGNYYESGLLPHRGMKLAREIATITYRSGPEWEKRFGRARADPSRPPALCADFLIETYLDHAGEKWSTVYDANSVLYISKAMDIFDLGLEAQRATAERRRGNAWRLEAFSSSSNPSKSPAAMPDREFETEAYTLAPPETPYTERESSEAIMSSSSASASDANPTADISTEPPEDLVKGLAPLQKSPTLVLGVASDILFPAWQQREIADTLRKAGNRSVTHVEFGEDRSLFGHDTFLLDLEGVGGEIRRFLG